MIVFNVQFSDINKSSTHLNKGDGFYSSSVQISRRQIKLIIVSSVILKSVDNNQTSHKRNHMLSCVTIKSDYCLKMRFKIGVSWLSNYNMIQK